jgi:hypothetical protein
MLDDQFIIYSVESVLCYKPRLLTPAEFVGMFMVYLHTNISNASLVINIRVKAKFKFHTAVMLFYFLPTFQDPTLSGIPISEVGITDGGQLKSTKVG